jgi:hypothetical protein
MNVEKTKYMQLFQQQNVVQNLDIKIANRSFENVSPLIYFGTTVKKKLCPCEGGLEYLHHSPASPKK